VRERERSRIFKRKAGTKRVNTRTKKKKERRPREEIALASQNSREKSRIRQKKSFQKGTSIRRIFSKIIFSLLPSSLQKRAQQITTHHPERRRRSAQNTRVCHSPIVTVDGFFNTSNAVVEVVFRSPHQKSFNLAKRDVVARCIFAFKLRNVVSSPERFFFFTAP